MNGFNPGGFITTMEYDRPDRQVWSRDGRAEPHPHIRPASRRIEGTYGNGQITAGVYDDSNHRVKV